MQVKPVRQFTVYVSVKDPGRIVEADTVDTVGDWFTLSLRGEVVYGASKDRITCYTASTPAGEAS